MEPTSMGTNQKFGIEFGLMALLRKQNEPAHLLEHQPVSCDL